MKVYIMVVRLVAEVNPIPSAVLPQHESGEDNHPIELIHIALTFYILMTQRNPDTKNKEYHIPINIITFKLELCP